MADTLKRVRKYVGQSNVPQDVKRRRRQVFDAMHRLGTPVIIKHMFNDDDVEAGIAERSPNYQSAYGQSRTADPLSFGIGYVSVEKSPNEWLSPTGATVQSSTSPGEGFIAAPKHRGFGQGYLTYVVEPDAAEDVFKLVSSGALIKVQTATAVAPWFPEIDDNDLLINVVLDGQGNVVQALERFQAKQTNPISMRGLDRRGRREASEDGGNRFVVNQTFEMALVPTTSILRSVPLDR